MARKRLHEPFPHQRPTSFMAAAASSPPGEETTQQGEDATPVPRGRDSNMARSRGSDSTSPLRTNDLPPSWLRRPQLHPTRKRLRTARNRLQYREGATPIWRRRDSTSPFRANDLVHGCDGLSSTRRRDHCTRRGSDSRTFRCSQAPRLAVPTTMPEGGSRRITPEGRPRRITLATLTTACFVEVLSRLGVGLEQESNSGEEEKEHLSVGVE